MPFKQTEGSIVDKIPAGLYCTKESLFGYYLEKKANSIELPEKIYGSTLDRAARCFSTYDRTAEPLTLGLFGSKTQDSPYPNLIRWGLPLIIFKVHLWSTPFSGSLPLANSKVVDVL